MELFGSGDESALRVRVKLFFFLAAQKLAWLFHKPKFV
jgi:hypothetical protein